MSDCACELDYTKSPIRIDYCDLHAHAADYKVALEMIALASQGQTSAEDALDFAESTARTALADATLKGEGR